MTRLMAITRMLVGAIVVGILIYTFVLGVPARGANPFDYFGYFTNLTALLAAFILIATGASTLRRGRAPLALHGARGVAVACMIVVGLIYNLIVPGTGTAPAWVSMVLHIALPTLLVLDWLLIADRPPLPWSRLWWVLPYPVVWLGVTLVRGAVDGWVPYGFLLPERGVWALVATSAALFATLVAAGALAWTMSRARLFVRR